MQSKKNFIGDGKLKKQRVVLTNATSEVGKLVAEMLAKAGAQLLLFDSSEEDLIALVEQLPSGRAEHQIFVLDLTKSVEIEKAAKKVATIYDSIDGLIHLVNVADTQSLRFSKTTTEQWQATFSRSARAPYELSRNLLATLQNSRQPKVIFVGSTLGKMPQAERSLESSVYFALRGLSLSLSREFLVEKVSFCHLALGERVGGKVVGERLVNMLDLGGLSDEIIIAAD